MVGDIYRAAGTLMQDAGKLAGVADEGGYWPLFESNEEALTMLVRAIEHAGFAVERCERLTYPNVEFPHPHILGCAVRS